MLATISASAHISDSIASPDSNTPAIISSSPLGHGLLVDNQVTTVAADQSTRLSVDRVPGTIMLNVRGQVAAGAAARTRRVAVDNPTTLFLNAFREALQRKGIFVGGSAIDIDELRQPPDMAGAQTWITDRSAPLYEIVDPLLKWSRNGYAETLLWTMSPGGAPASEAAGLAVLRDTLATLGVDASLYAAFDGSGLSRRNRVSTATLLALIQHAAGPDGEQMRNIVTGLPIAGFTGSLTYRFDQGPTVARGLVRANAGRHARVERVLSP